MARCGDEVVEVARWAEGIGRVHECIAGRFRRPEPRRRVLAYLRGTAQSGGAQKRVGNWRSKQGTQLPTGCSACCPATGGTLIWFAMI